MKQTFEPKHSYARAFGVNMRISPKSAQLICKVIRNKPLTRARRLLVDLDAKKRNLDGKYYSKTVKEVLSLLNSCEKNAAFKGLEAEKLFVNASAHKGSNLRRRRRKGAFGSTLKNTNMEILLVERGKANVTKKKVKEQLNKKSDVEKQIKKDEQEVKKELGKLKEEQKVLKHKVDKTVGGHLEKKDKTLEKELREENEELKEEIKELKEEQKEMKEDVKEEVKKDKKEVKKLEEDDKKIKKDMGVKK